MTYTATKQSLENTIPCPRCDARGFIPEYSHIASGRCFLCGGAKVIDKKAQYGRKGLICKVGRGYVNFLHPTVGGAYVRKFRTCVVLSFDGGYNYVGVKSAPPVIETKPDKNNPELEAIRDVWRWAKQAGAEMIYEED